MDGMGKKKKDNDMDPRAIKVTYGPGRLTEVESTTGTHGPDSSTEVREHNGDPTDRTVRQKSESTTYGPDSSTEFREHNGYPTDRTV
jgi:hypothetical protein